MLFNCGLLEKEKGDGMNDEYREDYKWFHSFNYLVSPYKKEETIFDRAKEYLEETKNG